MIISAPRVTGLAPDCTQKDAARRWENSHVLALGAFLWVSPRRRPTHTGVESRLERSKALCASCGPATHRTKNSLFSKYFLISSHFAIKKRFIACFAPGRSVGKRASRARASGYCFSRLREALVGLQLRLVSGWVAITRQTATSNALNCNLLLACNELQLLAPSAPRHGRLIDRL